MVWLGATATAEICCCAFEGIIGLAKYSNSNPSLFLNIERPDKVASDRNLLTKRFYASPLVNHKPPLNYLDLYHLLKAHERIHER